MHKSVFLKLRKLNHINQPLRFSNIKEISTLTLTDVLSQNKLLTSTSQSFLHRKRKFQRYDLCKNYSTLLPNTIGNFVGLYALPQFIVTRGMKITPPHRKDDVENLSHLFTPVKYEANEFEVGVGEEIVGPLPRQDILPIINRFYADDQVKELAKEQGIDKYLFQQTIISFRKYCLDTVTLPTELHIVISDIIKNSSHIHDLYPFFYKHAKDIFPHLSCMDDLHKVSDLTDPPDWYSEARLTKRKIIFHVGPTNSGKTYHALKKFLSSESGVYCGPLKLLAVEVHEKSNNLGTPCDLITGEERKYAISEEFPASHVSCTVEMTSLETKYEIAIIDEIQMVRDQFRGWAWTRAFLGLCAKEIHVCGEASAINIIKALTNYTGEELEVRSYERLTPLRVEDKALVSLDKIQPGDCIVCFSRQSIHKISQAIEKLGHEVAVIYGGLPPGAKLAQAKKFNDPDHPCKVMVATDAIGMGLNLTIRRIVFNTLEKPNMMEGGKKEIETISVSSALQIAGRAGRYGTVFNEGIVTTMKSTDLPILHKLLSSSPEEVTQAGLHPTADQIELFAFHLPNYTLSNLIDIFIKLCSVDLSHYFMCSLDDFKFLADLIQHVQLPLRARYVFCCAPINKKMTFVCALFFKFARQFSRNEPVTFHWLWREARGPFSTPKTIHDLVHLEEVFDVFDLYLWLSYRFSDMFPDAEMVREIQNELDIVIQEGVSHITQLLRISEIENQKFLKAAKNLAPIKDNDDDMENREETLKILSQSKSRKSKKHLSVADNLVKRGVISQKMMMRLKEELTKNNDSGNNTPRNSKK